MAWTNVFDIGECVIEVFDTSTFPPRWVPASELGSDWSVAEVGGEVTVEWIGVGDPSIAARVAPQYAVPGTPACRATITAASTDGTGLAVGYSLYNADGESMDFSEVEPIPSLPDSYTFAVGFTDGSAGCDIAVSVPT